MAVASAGTTLLRQGTPYQNIGQRYGRKKVLRGGESGRLYLAASAGWCRANGSKAVAVKTEMQQAMLALHRNA
jgi:hypothetical protein